VDSKEGSSTKAGWQNASKHHHLKGVTDRRLNTEVHRGTRHIKESITEKINIARKRCM
jgi:hypothetical protein